MKLLLDTHILLHALTEPERLAGKRRESIENPANPVFVSAVSIAEVAIKVSIGKLDVDVDLLPAVEEAGSRGSTSVRGRQFSWPNCRSTTGLRSTACWLSRAGPTISSW